MSSTFKFHSQVNETVPWQAQYSFPTQATKVNKQIVKLPPKNGSSFTSGQVIRIEFPADNYLNTLNSVLAMDVQLTSAGTQAMFQRGGAQNLIKRLRVMYGSLVLEDIQEYKTLVRIFTEAGVQQDYMSSTGTILDGMHSALLRDNGATTTVRAGEQLGAALLTDTTSATTVGTSILTNVLIPAERVSSDLLAVQRTYCLNLMSGLLTCKKLIPLKWMAAQLSIEITLATEVDAFLYESTAPVYGVSNVNFIAEMLEFDSTYDTAFYMGLTNGGVPLKFSSWHYHSFNCSGASQIFQIHERSRSVKAAFAVIRDASAVGPADSDRFYHDALQVPGATDGLLVGSGAAITQFQWRVGGRYYPSQPVRADRGGAEALVELLKTMDSLGDYTRASNINLYNWTSYNGIGQGSKFIMACEFENTDVMPDTIAGINAEEQSDIALSVTFAGAPSGKKADVFMSYDCLIIVKDGNVVELVL